jgi:prephenate dehydrogenase
VKTALFGCGLIGGSLTLALRKAGRLSHVTGFDPAAGERARALGIIDVAAATETEAVRGAELVIFAVPVRATAQICEAIAPAISPEAVVMDVGSTKAEVLRAVDAWLPFPQRFIAAHPIAGTERSGPEAADGSLFQGRRCLLTPAKGTRPECIAVARSLWEAAGAAVSELDAAHHDQALAWVSHLPHVAAFALAAAVGNAGDPLLEGLSGGGFVDTTRIAGSDAKMWRDVLLSNRDAVLASMRGLDAELAELRRAVAAGDGEELEKLIVRAQDGRRRILGGRK